MDDAAAFLVLGVQLLNTLHRDSNHGLFADLARQLFVLHPGNMQVRVAAIDPGIIWRSIIAKSFCESADLRPPLQGCSGIGGGQNGNSAFDSWFHMITPAV